MSPASGQDVQDTTLIQRICKKDEGGLECLYQIYYPRLYRFIGRVIWREDLIEDIINETLYTVWEKAATYNYQCRLSTWIFGIAYNKARQALRDEGYFKAEALEDVNEIDFSAEDEGLRQLELRDFIAVSLEVLSPDQRTVIELAYFHGLHYAEIALLMDCPENTVKTRMFHARKILMAHMSDYHDVPI